MANEWQVFPVRDLSGGTNILSNDFIHGSDELGLIINWNLDTLGSVTKITGYSSYGTRINDAINTLGIGNFYYDGGQRQLLAVDFGDGPVSPSSSNSPSPSPSASISPSSSVSPSPTPSASFSPSSSLSPSGSPSLSPSASRSPSASASPSSSTSPSPTSSPSNSPSMSPSVSPSSGYGSAEIFVFNPADNTWTTQNQGLTSGYNVEFCTFLGGLFACNFIDSNRYYDGNGWSTSTNLVSSPKSKYVISYNDRLYLGYIDVTGTTHSSRVLPSSLPDEATYAITWDTSASGPGFDVSPKDGDELKGFGKNFNRLLIFKEKSLWRYDTNSLYQFPGAPGTNNNRTIQNVLGYTIYFHTTGVYGLLYSSTTSDSVSLLSRAIKPIIDGVQSVNLDRLCSWTKGDHYYLFLHDVINEEAGINIPNCFVDLDVARMRWTVGSFAHTPRVFGTYRNSRTEILYDDSDTEYDYTNQAYDGYTSAQDFIYFGDENGDVRQIDTSNDFDGQIITSSFETVDYYIAGIQSRCELQSLKIYTEKGRRCKFYYSIDDGPWRPIVKYEYRDGEIYYTFESGLIINRIKLKCLDNSTGDRPSIKGFDFFFTPSYEI